MTVDEIGNNKIFEYVSGSHLYGFAGKESDKDVRGVFIMPKIFLVLNDKPQQIEDSDSDTVFFELHKYISLLSDNNPQFIESLFVPDNFVLYKNEIFDKIINNKKIFISKACKFRFLGYGLSQLKRIKTHRRYLQNPILYKPARKDFDLPEGWSIPHEQLQAIVVINNEYVKDEYKQMAINEIRYKQALEEWKSYQLWASERNKKRREIEEKYHYDCKHASHLVRLIKMGEDLLTKGKISFPLSYAEELLAIRNGAWSFEKIEEFSYNMERKFESLYESSSLPYAANHKKIRNLLIEITSEWYGINFKGDN